MATRREKNLVQRKTKRILLTPTGLLMEGVWAVAMPLIAEFQFTREIEDRLLAPIEISWLAIEKVFFGTLQALLAGLMVIPAAWLLLRPGVDLNLRSPLGFACVTLLVALFSACGGLALGCSVDQTHIGLMFSMVLTPMIFFWLHVLSLERSGTLSCRAANRPHKSPGLRQRGPSSYACAAVPASFGAGCAVHVDVL